MMKTNRDFGAGFVFLLALTLPATCFKLSSLKVEPELLTSSIVSDKFDSTSGISGRSTTEVTPSASAQDRINLSTKIDSTESATENATVAECDHRRETGIVIMISFNHFGFTKSSYLMQTTLDIMKELQNKGITIQLVIDDLTPIKNEPASFNKRDWILTSMVRKLKLDTFSPVRTWDMNIFGFLFIDNSMDFTDPMLINELRRVTFNGIKLYLIIVGSGVDREVINKFLIDPDQVINIESYDQLYSSLPSKLTEKLCVRQSKANIDIA